MIQLLPEILLLAPECPDPVALTALRRATEEFCRRSHAYQEWLDPVLGRAGITEYELDLPLGADLLMVLEVKQGAAELGYSVEMPDLLRLTAAPSPGSTIAVRAALVPAPTTDSLPPLLLRLYGETLVQGALGRLLVMPGKAWSNPETGAWYQRLYNAGIDAARAHTNRQHSGQSLRVAPRRFS